MIIDVDVSDFDRAIGSCKGQTHPITMRVMYSRRGVLTTLEDCISIEYIETAVYTGESVPLLRCKDSKGGVRIIAPSELRYIYPNEPNVINQELLRQKLKGGNTNDHI